MLTNPYTTDDYRMALNGEGPEELVYNWKDKPHRLVYDLVKEVEALNRRLKIYGLDK